MHSSLRLLPLALLLAVLPACGSESPKEANESPQEAIMKAGLRALDQMVAALEKVSSKESAQKAVETIKSLVPQMEKLSEAGKALGEPAKELKEKYEPQIMALQERMEAAMGKLKSYPEEEAAAMGTMGIYGDAKQKIAENEIRSMVEQVEFYRETRAARPEGLVDLVKVGALRNGQEDGTVLDPWKRPYVYELDDRARLGFVIYSHGEDLSSEEDDIRSDHLRR